MRVARATVVTRVSLVFEVVSRRANEPQRSGFRRIENRSDGLRLSPDPLDCRVVEGTLETAEVEVNDLAHAVMVRGIGVSNA